MKQIHILPKVGDKIIGILNEAEFEILTEPIVEFGSYTTCKVKALTDSNNLRTKKGDIISRFVLINDWNGKQYSIIKN